MGARRVFLDRGRRGTLSWPDLTGPALYTAVFAIVWWLNEVHAVGRLQGERARLLSITATTGDLSGKTE
jgi:hypothetical protein